MDPIAADPIWLAGFAAALVVTGVFAGIVAGLLGVGGGIVIVPVLFHIFTLLGIPEAVKMHLAVGTSLATIIPTSIISSRSHRRKGSVDDDLLRGWGPAVFAGVIVGTLLGGIVKGWVLTAVFATVALLVAANMAFRKEGSALAAHLPGRWPQRAIAAVIGGFSAVMGIGGGTLSVPILTAFSYPIRRAVGTASALGLIISVPGTIGFLIAGWGNPLLPLGSLGYVNLIGVALITPTTMLLAPYGAHLAHTISTNGLRKAFAAFLFITSVRMFVRLFG